MLFVSMAKVKAGTQQERIARRLQWKYPEGLRPVAEYWPIGCEYAVISVVEADSTASIMTALSAWNDVFDFTVAPVVRAEEGLEWAKQMMKS